MAAAIAAILLAISFKTGLIKIEQKPDFDLWILGILVDALLDPIHI